MDDQKTAIEEMLDTLEEAKEVHEGRRERRCCTNCDMITEGTRLNSKKDGRMELHYCADCERLLTTNEYERWRAVRGE